MFTKEYIFERMEKIKKMFEDMEHPNKYDKAQEYFSGLMYGLILFADYETQKEIENKIAEIRKYFYRKHWDALMDRIMERG